MKHLLLLLLVCFVVTGYSQTENRFDKYENYYEFLEDYYSDKNNEPENLDNFFTKRVHRNKKLWAAKLFPNGEVNDMVKSYYEYYKNFKPNKSSKTASVNWTCLGPTGVGDGQQSLGVEYVGRIHRITFDPNYNGESNQTIYASTSFGGLWKSINDGDSWVVLNTDLQLPSTAVSDIAVGFNNTNTLFISTGWADDQLLPSITPSKSNINPIYTHGIYRSTDGGQNWSPINNGFEQYFANEAITTRRIVVSPEDDNIVLFASSEGLFRTNNALSGSPYWLCVNDECDFRGIEFKPGESNVVYASGTDIFRSTDSGNTWESISDIYGLHFNELPGYFTPTRINIAVSKDDPERLYSYIIGERALDPTIGMIKQVYVYTIKFDDDNPHWEQILEHNAWNLINGEWKMNRAYSVYEGFAAIAANPFNALEVYIGYTCIKGTKDINNNIFKYVSPYSGNGYHADAHALAFPPNVETNKLYCGNDGGVSVKDLSVNGSQGWTSKNKGFQIGKIWTFDDYDSESEHYIALGHQDVAHSIFNEETGVWRKKFGGDGYGAQFDDNSGLLYNKNNSGFSSYNVSDGNFQSEIPFLPDDPAYSKAIVPATFKIFNHPIDNRPWFSFSELYKRLIDNPTGSSWEEIWSLESDGSKNIHESYKRQIVDFCISPANPDNIFFATFGYTPVDYLTENLGSNLFFSNTGGCNNSDNAWNVNGTPRFINLTHLLPNDNGNLKRLIMGMDVDPNNPNVIYLALSGYNHGGKVVKISYVETNTNTNWYIDDLDPNNSLPPININDIKYQYGSEGRLFVSTDVGIYYKDNTTNGIWEIYGNIPHTRVLDVKLNHYNNKIRAATFGRGFWEADFPCEDISISNSQIWNFTKTLCSNLEVNNGAVFTIDNLRTNSNSTISIVENSTMIVRDKVSLNSEDYILVEDGSRIIIEDGAELVYNGAQIHLQDPNSCLEIAGNLHIAENTEFKVTGNGYIKFSNSGDDNTVNITCGDGASIRFEGAGIDDKILEIQQKTVRFPQNLSSLEIVNGTVEMGHNKRMQADGNYPITFDHLKITSDNGEYNAHRSFHFYGQANVVIDNCIFEYGYWGLYGKLTYLGSPLTVKNSTFRYNNKGIYIYNKGLELFNCNFLNNTDIGVHCVNMSKSSKIYSSKIKYNKVGVDYQGSSTAGLSVYACNASNNAEEGIKVGGYLGLGLSCSGVSNNKIGVRTYDGASVNIAGYSNSIINNNVSISLTAGYLTLAGGYNNLTPKAGGKSLYGTITTIAVCGLPVHLDGDNNKYKSSGTDLVWGSDYRLAVTGCQPLSKIYVDVDNHESKPCIPKTGGSNNVVLGASLMSTSATDLSLDELIEDLELQLEDEDLSSQDYKSLVYSNIEIVETCMSSPLAEVVAVKKRAWTNIHRALDLYYASIDQNNEDSELLEIISAVVALNQELINDSEITDIDFANYSIDNALLYRKVSNYDEAISRLNALTSAISYMPNELAVAERWLCFIEAEKLAEAGILSADEFFAAVDDCQSTYDAAMQEQMQEFENELAEMDIEEEMHISINPNPNAGNFSVELTNVGESAQVRIVNSFGIPIETFDISCNDQSVSVTGYAAGTYTVYYVENDVVINSETVIVE